MTWRAAAVAGLLAAPCSVPVAAARPAGPCSCRHPSSPPSSRPGRAAQAWCRPSRSPRATTGPTRGGARRPSAVAAVRCARAEGGSERMVGLRSDDVEVLLPTPAATPSSRGTRASGSPGASTRAGLSTAPRSAASSTWAASRRAGLRHAADPDIGDDHRAPIGAEELGDGTLSACRYVLGPRLHPAQAREGHLEAARWLTPAERERLLSLVGSSPAARCGERATRFVTLGGVGDWIGPAIELDGCRRLLEMYSPAGHPRARPRTTGWSRCWMAEPGRVPGPGDQRPAGASAARGQHLRRGVGRQERSLRFSRARTSTCTGVPTKPNSSRSRRSTKRT